MSSNTEHELFAGDTIDFSGLTVPVGKELPGTKIADRFNNSGIGAVIGGPPNVSTSSVSFIQLGIVGPPDSRIATNITLDRIGDVFFNFEGTFDTSNASGYLRLRPKIGATVGNIWEHYLTFANSWSGVFFSDVFIGVAAGVHSFDMEWARGGGVGLLRGHTNKRNLVAYVNYP